MVSRTEGAAMGAGDSNGVQGALMGDRQGASVGGGCIYM